MVRVRFRVRVRVRRGCLEGAQLMTSDDLDDILSVFRTQTDDKAAKRSRTRQGEARPGQARPGEARRGQARAGQGAPLCAARPGVVVEQRVDQAEQLHRALVLPQVLVPLVGRGVICMGEKMCFVWVKRCVFCMGEKMYVLYG